MPLSKIIQVTCLVLLLSSATAIRLKCPDDNVSENIDGTQVTQADLVDTYIPALYGVKGEVFHILRINSRVKVQRHSTCRGEKSYRVSQYSRYNIKHRWCYCESNRYGRHCENFWSQTAKVIQKKRANFNNSNYKAKQGERSYFTNLAMDWYRMCMLGRY